MVHIRYDPGVASFREHAGSRVTRNYNYPSEAINAPENPTNIFEHCLRKRSMLLHLKDL